MQNKRKGFTLIEIMVSLVVFGIIMATGIGGFYKIYRDWQRQRDYSQCIENLRWAIGLITNEIRISSASDLRATEVPGRGNAYGHYKKLEYSIDPDNDGAGLYDVTFTLNNDDGSALVRKWKPKSGGGGWNTPQTLASTIQDNPDSGTPSHNHGHGHGTPTEVPFFNIDSNKLVTICLTTRPHPSLNGQEEPGNRDYTVRTMVKPRNK